MIIVIISRALCVPCPCTLGSWTSIAEVESFCKFYSEENKHIAVNRLSIGEAELYSKKYIRKVYITVVSYIVYI